MAFSEDGLVLVERKPLILLEHVEALKVKVQKLE